MATAKQKGGTLVGLVGAVSAALLITNLQTLEGTKNVGYLDIAGIPTKCSGDTTNVVVGKYYSDQECYVSTEKQALKHAADVISCTPVLAEGHDAQLTAASLLAYNIGGPAYCGSTAHRLFNSGKFKEACAAFAPWNKATIKGKRVVVKGLVNRRAFEMKLCMEGLK